MSGRVVIGALLLAVSAACARSDPNEPANNAAADIHAAPARPAPVRFGGGTPTRRGLEEVARFHEYYDEQDFASLFDAAGADIETADGLSADTGLLRAARSHFGPVVGTFRRDSRIYDRPDGRFLVARHFTRFQRAEAQETFVYRLGDGNRLALAGYQVRGEDHQTLLGMAEGAFEHAERGGDHAGTGPER